MRPLPPSLISSTFFGGKVSGQFPKRAMRAVLDWLDEHKTELMNDWILAEQRKPLNPIAPLE
jgi:hypothetical protein